MKINFLHRLCLSNLFLCSVACLSGVIVTVNINQVVAKIPISKPNTSIQKPLTAKQLANLQKLMKGEIQIVVDLSGLNKMPKPPTFNKNLRSHRAKWLKTNPEITPFLGYWVNYWEMSYPSVMMAVFPSTVRGQVCVIQYQDNQTHIIPPEETRPPNPPPKFSILKIRKGQGQLNQLRLHKSLIKNNQKDINVVGNIEFMGVGVGSQKFHLYASNGIAKLDSALPANILQKFKANQCRQS